jgi:hypothetical protein
LWRRGALQLFERACTRAARKGAGLDEAQLGDLYSCCFAEVIGRHGLVVPHEMLPDDKGLAAWVKEAPQ